MSRRSAGTADFRYARLRRSAYDDVRLREWAWWVQEATDSGQDCFVFLKHEDEGSPWIWADRLLELTKIGREEAPGP